jgi:predicted Zn-dependent peptidase
MYKKTQLPNGLRVISHRMSGVQSAGLGIWIKAGSRLESEENKGISHFLEHMLFKGSEKFSCRGIKEAIEGVGGSLNAFTSEETTCYLVKIPSRYLHLALDILSDMVLRPLLKQEEVDKERTVILEEIKMYRDLPQSYVYDLLDALLWPNQPLGTSIIGHEDSVSQLNSPDLAAYRKKYYTPFNIVVSAAGLVEQQKLTEQVKEKFSRLKDKNSNKFSAAKEAQHEPGLRIFPKDTEQTHLAMGFHSFKRDDPQRYAQALLHVILGANMSSRLFNEVREKRGLAYEIGTAVKRFEDTGAFIVHAGIDNHKVIEAVRVILEELGKIRDKEPAASELKRAKEFYLGQMLLSLEDTLDQMLWIGESTVCLDKTYTPQEIKRGIEKVSAAGIRKIAREILRQDNLNLALIGPLAGRDDELLSALELK